MPGAEVEVPAEGPRLCPACKCKPKREPEMAGEFLSSHSRCSSLHQSSCHGECPWIAYTGSLLDSNQFHLTASSIHGSVAVAAGWLQQLGFAKGTERSQAYSTEEFYVI